MNTRGLGRHLRRMIKALVNPERSLRISEEGRHELVRTEPRRLTFYFYWFVSSLPDKIASL